MTILQIDLTKFEYINKEEKAFALFNTLLEFSEELENLELKQLNENQTEILHVLYQFIKPEILVPSRIIRNQLGRCFQVVFSRGDCITLFDTFNILLKNILLPETKYNDLYIKWTILVIFKHIYLASGNKLSIHLNDTIDVVLKIFKISNNIPELRGSCFETLSEALNSYERILDENNSKRIFKFIKSGLSDEADIVKLKALICFKEFLKTCTPISGCTGIESIKTIVIKFIDKLDFSIHDQAAKILAISLILNSKFFSKDSDLFFKKNEETQMSNSETNTLPTLKEYRYSSDSKKISPFSLKHILDIYAKHMTNSHIERFIINIYSEFLEHCEKDWILNNYRFIIKNHICDIAHMVDNIKDKQKISTTRNIICNLLDLMRKKMDETSQFKALKILNNEYLSIWLHKESLTQAKKVVLTSILYELSRLILTLNCTINIIHESIRNNLLFILNCPSLTVQKYASWCIECFLIVIPNDMEYLANFCLKCIKEFICTDINTIDSLSKLRVRGHALALSRLICIGKKNPLYISSDIFSEIFSISYSILKQTTNTIQTVIIPIQIAWILISSLMKLESCFVRNYLSQLFTLWENTLLKHSTTSFSTEINITEILFLLYTQEYALGSIFSFLLYNKELLTTNVLKKINTMINEANTIFILFSKRKKNSTFLDKHVQLSQETLEIMVQKRILQCYLLILWRNPTDPIQSGLVSHLITNFANPSTSMIKNTSDYRSCYLQFDRSTDGILSFIHLQNFSDHQENHKINNNNILKNHVLINSDNINLNSQENNSLKFHDIFSSFEEVPLNELSIYIEIIDLSILLFGIIFLNQSNKIKESILEQLITFITFSSETKYFQQRNAVICNSNIAILIILRFIENNESQINNLKNTKTIDLMEQIAKYGTNSYNSSIRKISCETIGRLSCFKEKENIFSIIKFYIKQVIEKDDPNIRSTNALCLGRILNHCGKMLSISYISKILDILQSLSVDRHPEVCFWALESITIGIQSFGPSISLYCLNILNIISKIYSEIDYNINDVSVVTCDLSFKSAILSNLAKCLNAIVNIFGPDLQKNIEAKKIVSMLIKGLLLENDEDVLTAAIYCTQHILLFSSDLLNPYLLIKLLQKNIMSKHRKLADASIRSLYQLMQRSTLNIFKLGQNNLDTCIWLAYDLSPEHQELKNIIEIWLHHTLDSQQDYWIQLCLKFFEKKNINKITQKFEDIDISPQNEFSNFKTNKSHSLNSIQKKLRNLRWQTQKLILQCINNLFPYTESFLENNSDSQVHPSILHLSSNVSSLIKIGFIASTSKNYNIRLEGLKIIQKIIKVFSPLKDPYFPTSSLLEQYEAQLISAIIPSFSSESTPEIAALAIHICPYFLTSGILKEISKTGRIVKLLISSLLNLKNIENTVLIGDMECSNKKFQFILKLSIISSWAELQIASQSKTYLNSIIKPNIELLASLWIISLNDYAKFYFSTYELSNDLTYLTSQSTDFYKIFMNINNNELFEICSTFWINVIYAVTILLESNEKIIFKTIEWYKLNILKITKLNKITSDKNNSKLFFLLFGLCFEALLHFISNKKVINTNKQKLYILLALEKILNTPLYNEIIYYNLIFSELVTLLRKLLLMEHSVIQMLIIRITTNLINNFPEKNKKNRNKYYKNKFKNLQENTSKHSEQLFQLSKIIILPFIIYFKNLNSINDLKTYNENISKLLIYSLESYIKTIKIFPLMTQYDLYDYTFFIILKLYYDKNSYDLIPKILPLVKIICEDILIISKTNKKNFKVLQNLIENVIERIIKIIKNSSSTWNYGLLLITTIITTTGQILSPKSKSLQKYFNLFIEPLTDDKTRILIHCMKSLLRSSFYNIQRYVFQCILSASLNIIRKAHLDLKKSFTFDMGTNACDIIIDLIKNISKNDQQYIAIITIIPVLVRFASIKELELKHKREISFKLLSLIACYSKNFHQILQEIPEKDSDMLRKLFKSTTHSNIPINLDQEPKISLKKKFIN
ncbi:hypothetical protein PORY_002373 [Pneumocystis oryctolagi]|uniref:Uncharacterized protein n=1 Tax=Pneumocystis oryctolagi TaxID=42067 RepID=A0ACB7CAV0_9ASCO|nr:hypothetical protein PORY_002373 [Pneumocystis oryctolagi]